MEKPGLKPIDELIRRAIIGDGAAFTELWDTHIVGLRSYLRSSMKNLDDFYIDDVCSRSFEKAFRQIRSYDPSRSQFATWLRVIAHNTALDIIEQENRLHSSCVYLDADDCQVSVIENLGGEEATPLDAIIINENNEQTQKYIDGLPQLYHDIAHKRLIEGMSYKDIAEETQLELNTVRTRIRRAKALIDKMKTDNV